MDPETAFSVFGSSGLSFLREWALSPGGWPLTRFFRRMERKHISETNRASMERRNLLRCLVSFHFHIFKKKIDKLNREELGVWIRSAGNTMDRASQSVAEKRSFFFFSSVSTNSVDIDNPVPQEGGEWAGALIGIRGLRALVRLLGCCALSASLR